jgi:hypothetical protein
MLASFEMFAPVVAENPVGLKPNAASVVIGCLRFDVRHCHHLQWVKYFETFRPLKVRAVRYLETLVSDCPLIQRRIPEGRNSDFVL